MIKAKEKWEVRSHGKTQREKKKVFLGENEKKKNAAGSPSGVSLGANHFPELNSLSAGDAVLRMTPSLHWRSLSRKYGCLIMLFPIHLTHLLPPVTNSLFWWKYLVMKTAWAQQGS